MDPPLLSTISFDEKKAVAFVYPASRFKLATIGALMNYARLMLIGLSASQSPRMNQLNQPQVLPYFHQPSLFRTRIPIPINVRYQWFAPPHASITTQPTLRLATVDTY
ncbi:hypothetical protein [Coxiella burnetii]|uniref:hypothetical protein n=1 Tax=Coxiella burnetii TaxID=777 RepID=UPI000AC731A2|nr:hypothetical protein [Coxiella burnetii]